MKKTKSNLDELQELKLLKIEHNGCWLAFWGLLAVILTQIAIGNDSRQDLAGEWIVFMCLALYLTVGCIRNGIWDRKLKPNFKNNIMASSIAAVVMGILWFYHFLSELSQTRRFHCNWSYYVFFYRDFMFSCINAYF